MQSAHINLAINDTSAEDGDTPIITQIKKLAHEKDQKQIQSALLKFKGYAHDVNKKNGKSPLIVAVLCGNLHVVQCLLSPEMLKTLFSTTPLETVVNHADKDGNTALVYAVQYEDNAQETVESNTSVTNEQKDGSANKNSFNSGLKNQFDIKDKREIIKILFDKGNDVGFKGPYYKESESFIKAHYNKNLFFILLVIKNLFEAQLKGKVSEIATKFLNYSLDASHRRIFPTLLNHLLNNNNFTQYLYFSFNFLIEKFDKKEITKEDFMSLINIIKPTTDQPDQPKNTYNNLSEMVWYLAQSNIPFNFLEKQNIMQICLNHGIEILQIYKLGRRSRPNDLSVLEKAMADIMHAKSDSQFLRWFLVNWGKFSGHYIENEAQKHLSTQAFELGSIDQIKVLAEENLLIFDVPAFLKVFRIIEPNAAQRRLITYLQLVSILRGLDAERFKQLDQKSTVEQQFQKMSPEDRESLLKVVSADVSVLLNQVLQLKSEVKSSEPSAPLLVADDKNAFEEGQPIPLARQIPENKQVAITSDLKELVESKKIEIKKEGHQPLNQTLEIQQQEAALQASLENKNVPEVTQEVVSNFHEDSPEGQPGLLICENSEPTESKALNSSAKIETMLSNERVEAKALIQSNLVTPLSEQNASFAREGVQTATISEDRPRELKFSDLPDAAPSVAPHTILFPTPKPSESLDQTLKAMSLILSQTNHFDATDATLYLGLAKLFNKLKNNRSEEVEEVEAIDYENLARMACL